MSVCTITGATGFIGMYTVEELVRSGEQVVGTGRNETLGAKLEEMGVQEGDTVSLEGFEFDFVY